MYVVNWMYISTGRTNVTKERHFGLGLNNVDVSLLRGVDCNILTQLIRLIEYSFSRYTFFLEDQI
jgi:hypothetical protein